MLFTKANAKLVMSGQKTQTRRPIKDREAFSSRPIPNNRFALRCVTHNGRLKWKEGRTYAVQPGRGEHAIGRIRILHIDRERLRSITDEDAIAEGINWQPGDTSPRVMFAELWRSIYRRAGERWEDNPFVWVLKFRVERDA